MSLKPYSIIMGKKCSVYFLGLINVLFLLLGLGFLVLGMVMKVDTKLLDKDEVIATLNQITLNHSLKFGSMVANLAVLTICIGAFIFAIASLGFIGAVIRSRLCLVLTEKSIKDHLLFSMNKYEGVQSANELSKGWDIIFIGLDCCGIDAVGPFNNQEFNGTAWWQTRGWDMIPFSCCSIATLDNLDRGRIDLDCTTMRNGYRIKGCYQAFKDYLKIYEIAAIVIGFLLLVTELLAATLAFMLCRTFGSKERLA